MYGKLLYQIENAYISTVTKFDRILESWLNSLRPSDAYTLQ